MERLRVAAERRKYEDAGIEMGSITALSHTQLARLSQPRVSLPFSSHTTVF